MKARFSSLDITQITTELQALVGKRLLNIYDLSAKTILLKFSGEKKENLLLESGIRMHLTQFQREKSSLSSLNIKMRKHLKSKRLVKISQLGVDRVVDLSFGEGEYGYQVLTQGYHLIIEFYATGNIILADSNYKIMTLLRIVELSEGGEKHTIAVGQVYDISKSKQFEKLTKEKLLSFFQAQQAKSEDLSKVVSTRNSTIGEADDQNPSVSLENIIPDVSTSIDQTESRRAKRKYKKKQNKEENLINIVKAGFSGDYGPALIDHILSLSGLDSASCDFSVLCDSNSKQFLALYNAFITGDEIIASCSSPQKGYIVSKSEDGIQIYNDFQPFRQNSTSQILEFPTFNDCVDEYFSKLESQKFEMKAKQAENASLKKLANVRASHANQISSFEMAVETKKLYASSIENNRDLIDSVINTVRSFVASGMDWEDLKELVREEKEKGNPLANVIVGWKLDVGMIVVGLPDPSFDNEEDHSDESVEDTIIKEDQMKPSKHNRKPAKNKQPILKIDLDIYASAFANARSYYDMKKVAAVKAEKTKIASGKALEIAEKKINRDLLSSTSTVPAIKKARLVNWWEKFNWFISTENYLILGSRDKVQAEMLLSKYFVEGDVLINSDIDDAPVVICKNFIPGTNPIPPSTLLQAGTMCTCFSRAWEAKIVTSAFYVTFEQVSRQMNGQKLPIGGFIITGKKNYLPPAQLIYGIALLFEVDENSCKAHFLERRPWARGGVAEDFSLSEEQTDSKADEIVEVEGEEAEDDISDKELNQSLNSLSLPAEAESKSSESESDGEFPDTQVESLVKCSEINLRIQESSNTVNPMAMNVADEESQPLKSPNLTKPLPRGRKGKIKKIKEKYGDQDEDVKAAMIDLLAPDKGPQPKGKKAKAKAANAIQLEERQKKWEKAKLEKKDTSKQPVKTDKRNSSIINDEAVNMDLSAIDYLTGQPNAVDNILHCVPVCAPWIAMQKYKYKIKLIPGSLKRGKAAKSAEMSFLKMSSSAENSSAAEVECINAVPEAEWLQTIIPKVKLLSSDISMNGGKKR